MDFELNADQQAVLEAVESLLDKHAGAARAIELAASGGYDQALEAALDEAGFGDLATAAWWRWVPVRWLCPRSCPGRCQARSP